MKELRVSLGITTGISATAARWIGENANRLGAEGIWIGEDIGRGQDIFVLTAATIIRARKARVGTAILPITTRDLLTIARAAYSLHHLRPEGFVFGTGIGGLQDLRTLGIEIERPVSLLRTALVALRRLWAGETVTVNEEIITLENADLGMKQTVSIPIFLGVRGPQMLQLAGEFAEGVILSGPREYLKWAVEIIDRAAKKVGRKPSEIERVAWLPTIPTFVEGNDRLAKKVVALVIADTPPKVLDLLAIDRESVEQVKREVTEKGVDAGAQLVDSEMLDTFSVSGTEEHMVDIFEKIIRDGATEVIIGPPFSRDWRKAVEMLFDEIRRRK